jgi:hypothetical protein
VRTLIAVLLAGLAACEADEVPRRQTVVRVPEDVKPADGKLQTLLDLSSFTVKVYDGNLVRCVIIEPDRADAGVSVDCQWKEQPEII